MTLPNNVSGNTYRQRTERIHEIEIIGNQTPKHLDEQNLYP